MWFQPSPLFTKLEKPLVEEFKKKFGSQTNQTIGSEADKSNVKGKGAVKRNATGKKVPARNNNVKKEAVGKQDPAGKKDAASKKDCQFFLLPLQ